MLVRPRAVLPARLKRQCQIEILPAKDSMWCPGTFRIRTRVHLSGVALTVASFPVAGSSHQFMPERPYRELWILDTRRRPGAHVDVMG